MAEKVLVNIFKTKIIQWFLLGLSKSFRKMASGLQMKNKKREDDDDEEEVQVRSKRTNQLQVKTVSAKRR